jgi:hypothetical protein
MSSALQGDGTFYDRNKTKEFIKFYSANINYLKFIQNQLNKYNVQFGGPYKGLIYKTEKGTRQQFQLSLLAKNNLNAINFFENIIPGIEMIRKKVNAENSLKWLKERQ